MKPETFYNQLSSYYDLAYADWNASIRNQASQLHRIIRRRFGQRIASVLDVSCGIGTQAIGLAELGYSVTSSDVAESAVRRARREARRRGLRLTFGVSDMRDIWERYHRTFDLVISCDNSLPHLLKDSDILRAFRQMYKCTRVGGGCLVTVRDYDAIDRKGQHFYPYKVRASGRTRTALFQIWDFHGQRYTLSMYRLTDTGKGAPRVSVLRTEYYAVSTRRLLDLMIQAGYTDVERLDGEFYQPVLTGRRT
jgi:SAM-dependent methyltransferase